MYVHVYYVATGDEYGEAKNSWWCRFIALKFCYFLNHRMENEEFSNEPVIRNVCMNLLYMSIDASV